MSNGRQMSTRNPLIFRLNRRRPVEDAKPAPRQTRHIEYKRAIGRGPINPEMKR